MDSVVAAFLAGQTPTRDDVLDDDEKLGFWWEDESLANSENAEELGDAIDSMKRMLQDLKQLQRDHQHVVVENENNNNNNNASFTLRGNDDVGEGCSNFDQIFDSEVHESQSQVMPMINLDDDDFFSSDFFNDIDIDALYASINF
ncbi:PREDICTED: agamous-like MADS-box protein AGL97 [Camelina sativa]|uniref:Agamous-like MADS-box protein AGL97 n=1 Tax=Camelina sativa TaxID=90675 RepID=A0ABM0TTJ1_CAMSA|nr:PREDICTED: agamous-like MADS-box protein AGL97 [Camelina sativa]